MLLTTHALSGAFLATKIRSPIISYPLILSVHFLMDWLPHWDFGTGFRTAIKKAGDRAAWVKTRVAFWGLIDLFLGLGLVFFLFQKEKTPDWQLWTGVFLSLLPDFLEVPPLFFNFYLPPLAALENLHSRRCHHSQPFPQGLFWQMVILATIFYFTLAK